MKKNIFIFLCIFLCGCLFSCTLITHFDSDKSSGSESFDPNNFNPTADIFFSRFILRQIPVINTGGTKRV